MIKTLATLLAVVTLAVFGCRTVKAETPALPTIIINEIAWMGTKNSANDEWIELKNTTQNPIDLTGWIIMSTDKKLKISLQGIISPRGFYLAERTDDTSVVEVAADLIYKGSLNNAGMDVQLQNASGSIIDEVSSASKWVAGNNITKQTMERTSSLSWQTSKGPEGTPRTINSQGASLPKTSTTLPKVEKSDNKVSVLEATLENSTDLGIIEEKTLKNPWLFFLLSLAIVITLSIVILLFKLKVFIRLNNFTK